MPKATTERAAARREEEQHVFLGLYDFAWEMRGGLHAYLNTLREESPELWRAHIGITIPEEGCYRSRDAVLIPAHSEDLLVENESIADNLILPLSRRVAYRKMGIISPGIRENILREFGKQTGLSESSLRAPVRDLPRTERKILSIFRYALGRPSAILLDGPYTGFGAEQAARLRTYLYTLYGRGIRILYFSKDREQFYKDCRAYITTENGRGGILTTF